MILYIAAIAVLALWGMQIELKGFYVPGYLEPENTLPIKGIFTLLIFASHFCAYVQLAPGLWNDPYQAIRRMLGQLVVSLFLFYSGYGVMRSFQARGQAYVKRMPVHRFLKVLIQFDLAILLFLVTHLLLGRTFSLKHILLTMVGWLTVSNSNWYIFAILFLYLASCISFWLLKKEWAALAGVAALTAVFVWLMTGRREVYCYNTVFTYATGMGYACLQPKIEKTVFSKNRNYLLALALLLVAFRLTHKFWRDPTIHQLTSICFALIVVLLTAKVKFTSPALSWVGKHLFSIYILQRIPMILFQGTALAQHVWAYFIVCFVLTMPLCAAFDRAFALIWQGLNALCLRGKK